MAENENTFIILQSLLTCVCEQENHGSIRGEWVKKGWGIKGVGVGRGAIYDLRLKMAENENTFLILQVFSCMYVCEQKNHGLTKGEWGLGGIRKGCVGVRLCRCHQPCNVKAFEL